MCKHFLLLVLFVLPCLAADLKTAVVLPPPKEGSNAVSKSPYWTESPPWSKPERQTLLRFRSDNKIYTALDRSSDIPVLKVGSSVSLKIDKKKLSFVDQYKRKHKAEIVSVELADGKKVSPERTR